MVFGKHAVKPWNLQEQVTCEQKQGLITISAPGISFGNMPVWLYYEWK